MDTVYIETTVVGHLVGRLHPDPAIAARQYVTRKWWTVASAQSRLLISQVVRDECGRGDPSAARERLEVIDNLAVLGTPEEIAGNEGDV
jgi:hypothetical protein